MNKAKQIKMCKDMQYLIDRHDYNYCSLGEELDVSPRAIRTWIAKGNKVNMQDATLKKVSINLHQLKDELKKAKEYQPNETTI